MRIRTKALLAGSSLAMAVASAFGAPPLQPETLRIEPMPPRGDHWIYTVDYESTTDAKLTLYDIDKKKLIAQHGAGFMPGVARSADHRYNFVATSYFSRGTTGERTDVLEITDNQCLSKVGEVILPPKHAQQIPLKYNTSVSDDGGFVYVTNITPATSVAVVDLAKRTVASEVDTAACVLAYPSGPYRFTSLCQSGKALTVTLDKDGKEINREQSETFIDVENDRKVVSADFSASPAHFDKPWAIVTPQEEKEGWRPGGFHPFAVHQATNRLYVGMHKGKDGSHKEPATEIWVYDMKSHKRLARWKLTEAKLAPLMTLSVIEGDKPLVYGSAVVGIQAFDAATGKLVQADMKAGKVILFSLPY
jgi:methylamine dehydrogenase heavy chain